MNMVHYSCTERGSAVIAIGGTILLSTIVLALILRTAAALVPLAIGVVIVVLSTLIFASIQIEVLDDQVKFVLGPGIIRRSIPLGDIVSCATRPIDMSSGLGWRINGKRTLVTVGSKSAVALILRDGRSFWLGSDHAPQVCQAIEMATARSAESR